MKKTLQEQIDRINQIINITNRVIIEGSKKNILINKLNLDADYAEWFESHCGRLSVWMVNKIFKHIKDELLPDISDDYLNLTLNSADLNYDNLKLNDMGKLLSQWKGHFNHNIKPKVISIMDYITVSLDGNISSLKEDSFLDIYLKSKEWHDSLETGSGDINYTENNEIIIDFRDNNGIGFYWVDLNTNDSDEECERMGHCGRTGHQNILYSLRQVKLINNKYTINTSHVTASVSPIGEIMQMKGKKNTKPKEKYHKYIIPFLLYKHHNGEYMITGFSSEYEKSYDFKLTDLNDDQIIKLYKIRPDIFNTLTAKTRLNQLGLIEMPNLKFTLEIEPDDISEFVKLPKFVDPGFVNSLVTFEYDDYYDRSYSDDWDDYIFMLNDENLNTIFEYLHEKNKDNDEFLLELKTLDKSNKSELHDFIIEWDNGNPIRMAIIDSVNSIEGDKYFNHYRGILIGIIEDTYGKVHKMNDGGIVFDVDLSSLVNNTSELDEYIESCNGYNDLECVLRELIADEYYFEKPSFEYDDRYTPYVDTSDTKYFNEMFSTYFEFRSDLD